MKRGGTAQIPGGQPPPMCAGPTGFLMIFMGLFLILIMFDPGLRTLIGVGMGALLHPVIGFDGLYPMVTIFLAAIILVIISTLIRHYFVDWVELAKVQKYMSAYNKELRDATLSNNMIKVKKLRELQPEIMKMQSSTMGSQLKPMIFTMFIAIAIWMWLFIFVATARVHWATLPWEVNWSLVEPIPICGPGVGYWLLLYIIFSIPFGILLQSALKLYSFSKKLELTTREQRYRAEDELEACQRLIADAEREGIKSRKLSALIGDAREALERDESDEVFHKLNLARDELERLKQAYQKALEFIRSANNALAAAKAKGVGLKRPMGSLKDADIAFNRSEYSTAIFYAKRCLREIRDAKRRHEDASSAISEVKALMYDIRELDAEDAGRLVTAAEDAMKVQDYERVMTKVKEARREAERIKKEYNRVNTEITNARNAITHAKELGIDVSAPESLLASAERAVRVKDYKKALSMAVRSKDDVERLKTLYRDAEEAISFAKLVVANARSFGADVTEAETLLQEAEKYIACKDYNNAKQYADKSTAVAETAKRMVIKR